MTAKFRVGVTDHIKPPFAIESAQLGEDYELISLDLAEGTMPDAGVLEQLDALLVWHATIGPAIIERLDRTLIVVRYGVGYDNIDIEALSSRGIAFCNTPDYGVHEVADTAVAMILALHRRINEYDQRCRSYDRGWQEHVLAPIKRASDTIVGIVGVGRIGGAVARRLQSFGYQIVGFDPFQPAGHEKSVGYERANNLSALLGQCDIVTLHCPLNAATHGMVNDAFLAAIRRGAILVNTARGGLIDDLDRLYHALVDGPLAAVGLDVLPEEPPRSGQLIDTWKSRGPELLGRVLINPHTAYYSDRAAIEMRQSAAATIRLFHEQGVARNRVAV